MSSTVDISAAKSVPKYRQTVPQYASPIIIDGKGRRWAKSSRFARERGMHPMTMRKMARLGLIETRPYGHTNLYLLDSVVE